MATARTLYEASLIELNKLNAPNITLEDFNYFANKAVNQYINKRYNIYDINQLTTDDLRVLKATTILNPSSVNSIYDDLTNAGSGKNATYECVLPSDYLHMLNCICIYNLNKTYKCYNKGDKFRAAATRLTADAYSTILDNYWNRPTYKRPYYYIHNVNTSTEVPTNPYNQITKTGTDLPTDNQYLTINWEYLEVFEGTTSAKYFKKRALHVIENSEETDIVVYEWFRETARGIKTVYTYEVSDTNIYSQDAVTIESETTVTIAENKEHYIVGTATIHTETFKCKRTTTKLGLYIANCWECGGPIRYIFSNITEKGLFVGDEGIFTVISLPSDETNGDDAWGNPIINTSSINIFDSTSGTSNIERSGIKRYGNASQVRLEIRYGTDNSVFELQKVYIDYIKVPQTIRLTQEQLDKTEDTSQVLEFPDYVCQEIINELVLILMENISDPKLLTHPVVSLSIANPTQQLTPQPQQSN